MKLSVTLNVSCYDIRWCPLGDRCISYARDEEAVYLGGYNYLIGLEVVSFISFDFSALFFASFNEVLSPLEKKRSLLPLFTNYEHAEF